MGNFSNVSVLPIVYSSGPNAWEKSRMVEVLAGDTAIIFTKLVADASDS